MSTSCTSSCLLWWKTSEFTIYSLSVDRNGFIPHVSPTSCHPLSSPWLCLSLLLFLTHETPYIKAYHFLADENNLSVAEIKEAVPLGVGICGGGVGRGGKQEGGQILPFLSSIFK